MSGKEKGIIINVNGLIEMPEGQALYDDLLSNEVGGLSNIELRQIFMEILNTRNSLVLYNKRKQVRRQLEDSQERWGQIIALEMVLRFVRDTITKRENKNVK